MNNEKTGFQAEPNQNEKRAREAFSMAGLACFVIFALGYAVKYLLQRFFPGLSSYAWGIWFLSFAPTYVIGVPVCVLIFHRIPAYKGVDGKGGTASLKPGQIVRAVFIAIFLLRVGGVIGNAVTEGICSLTGASTETKMTVLAQSDLLVLKILVMAILGPLIEELIFRKLLIDRIGCYGGKLAVLTSALMFGLFHKNFTQFFYAFAVGLLFAYIYLKTGKFRYSAGLHIMVNSIGILEATALKSVTDIVADFESASNEQILLFVVWGLLEVVAVFIGMVLFYRSWRKATYEPARMELPEGSGFRTAYLNVGMLLFVVFCAVYFVINVLP